MAHKDDFADRVDRAVGERITSVRRVRRPRLTQGQLAERTRKKLSRSLIANIERGRQRIAVHQLYLIAGALGVDVSSLLPPMDVVPGTHAGGLPSDPKERAFLSKITGQDLGSHVEEGANAATKSD
jgi:transcriptional regulator with XRE-family HTH domain